MSNAHLSLLVDDARVSLGRRSSHALFSNPPQNVVLAQPDLSACIPKQAEELFAAKSNEQLMIAMGKLLAELDFDTFIVAVHYRDARDPDDVPSAAIMGQCRPDWIRRYDEEGYVDVDPRLAHCMSKTSPYFWDSTIFAGHEASGLFEEAASFGLRAGISAPLLTQDGFLGMFSVSSSMNMTKSELMSPLVRGRYLILKDYLTELLSPTSGKETRLAGELSFDPDVTLTRRERQVLMLAAQGYNVTQMSDKLKISESTIRAHIGMAKTRLGVYKTAHAVARALKHTLIPFPD